MSSLEKVDVTDPARDQVPLDTDVLDESGAQPDASATPLEPEISLPAPVDLARSPSSSARDAPSDPTGQSPSGEASGAAHESPAASTAGPQGQSPSGDEEGDGEYGAAPGEALEEPGGIPPLSPIHEGDHEGAESRAATVHNRRASQDTAGDLSPTRTSASAVRFDATPSGTHLQPAGPSLALGLGGSSFTRPALGLMSDDAARRLELLEQEVTARGEQLRIEQDTRRELEDMLLRLERLIKEEERARTEAEEALREVQTKYEIEESRRQHSDDLLRETESELEVARVEIKKLRGQHQASEDTIRDRIEAQFQVQMSRMMVGAEQQVASLSAELRRVRYELEYRTETMSHEMTNWRQQAEATSRALLEARTEVLTRKRELDSTNTKLGRLFDVLTLGTEAGHLLQSSIDGHISRTAAHAQVDSKFAKKGQAMIEASAAGRVSPRAAAPALKASPNGKSVAARSLDLKKVPASNKKGASASVDGPVGRERAQRDQSAPPPPSHATYSPGVFPPNGPAFSNPAGGQGFQNSFMGMGMAGMGMGQPPFGRMPGPMNGATLPAGFPGHGHGPGMPMMPPQFSMLPPWMNGMNGMRPPGLGPPGQAFVFPPGMGPPPGMGFPPPPGWAPPAPHGGGRQGGAGEEDGIHLPPLNGRAAKPGSKKQSLSEENGNRRAAKAAARSEADDREDGLSEDESPRNVRTKGVKEAAKAKPKSAKSAAQDRFIETERESKALSYGPRG